MSISALIHPFTQFALPMLTIAAQTAIAMKHPALGLILNLLAQPFWIYSSWRSYREAGQIGIFITTIIFTCITIYGVLNYSVL